MLQRDRRRGAHRRRLLARCVLYLGPGAGLLLALCGCAGDGPNATPAGSEFDVLQREVFNVHCISGACHNSQTLAGGLNLAPGLSYGQLVGVEPDNPTARDLGFERVQPFVPDNSFLLRKLVNPTAPEGSRMPLGADPLPPAMIDLVRSWIEKGAPEGADPSPTPSAIPSPTATASRTATPTHSPAPTTTTTTTLTATATATSALPTLTGTRPPTPTATPSGTPTQSPTVTVTPTATPSPTITPTLTVAPGSTLADLQVDIFTPRCAVQGCHTDATGPFNGDLSLEAGSTYAAVVGVEPQNPVALDAGLLRVDPGSPDNSFLLRKVVGPGPGEGSLMPLVGPPLTAEEIDRIRAWIERGAPPEE